MASAYAVVPTKEELETVPISSVELHCPAANSVSPEFLHIPEAKELTWRDDFFDDERNVVAVFDFDYDNMEQHYKALGWGCFVGTAFCFPGCLVWCLLGLVPCHINKNVNWSVRAQHLAVTRDGILFVHDRRPALYGEECAVPKRTQLIPFDQIKECTVTDSGTTTTCTILGSALSKVSINHETPTSFHIVGLTNPHGFQKLVMALKRQELVIPNNNISSATAATVLPVTMVERIDRGGLAASAAAAAQNNHNGDDVAGILREIRDELRQHNEMLQAIKQPQQQE